MHERIDAERTVRSDQTRRHALDVVETRPPDERPVTEHPQVLVEVIKPGMHGGGTGVLT
jgi:hypothetical protein